MSAGQEPWSTLHGSWFPADGGTDIEATNGKIFVENAMKYWRTGREGCILVRLSYCPESFLRQD
jgi:hypothetical protein